MSRVAVVIGLLLFACGPSGIVRTAYYGDLKSLKAEIRGAQQSGELDKGEVADLARAVARRELRSSQGRDSLLRIREARTCTDPVEAELRERAERYDDAGAEAMLVLIDADLVARKPLLQRYAGADNGAWRAVAARTTALHNQGSLRRRYIQDPDERVRRSALRASLELADGSDVDALVDAARLDPNPLNRSLAVRALGSIGGERVVLALRDRWERSDEQERLTLIDGWAAPPTLRTGGKRELVRVLDTNASLPAIAAAAALLRASDGASDRAQGVLVQGIGHGTGYERRLSIQLVRLEPASIAALDKATADNDAEVRALSLARLLDVPERRNASRDALRKLAAGTGHAAREARTALASIDDLTIETYFRRDLASVDPWERQLAAFGLVQLGRYGSAATALADDDGRVRMAVACRILSDERQKGAGDETVSMRAHAD